MPLTFVTRPPGQPLCRLARSDAREPELILVDDVPVLAWVESDTTGSYILVAEFETGRWNVIGDRINLDRSNVANDPSLAYDPDTNTLYCAFDEVTDGESHVFVMARSYP